MGETPVYKNAIPSYFSSDVIVMWSLCLCSTFRWVSQKTEITRSQLIVLSTVFFFSAFWKHGGQVGESPSSPLEISKTAKFEGHCWKRTKYSSSKSCLRANVTYFLCCNKRNRRRLHAGNMVLNAKSLVASVQRSLQQDLSWRTTPIVAHFPQSMDSQLWSKHHGSWNLP